MDSASSLPSKSTMSSPFSSAFVKLTLQLLLHGTEFSATKVVISGYDLTTSALLKISSNKRSIVTVSNLDVVQTSREAFDKVLNSGATIYGVNTGFGGSAGARTGNHGQLQVALIQTLNSASYTADIRTSQQAAQMFLGVVGGIDFADTDASPVNMPIEWVRAAMLIRANTLLRGNSGVTQGVVAGITKLLNASLIPVIPLHGSISASGDLSPMSFVASALQGNPTTMVFDHSDPATIQVVAADEALESISEPPLIFGPKEALAIVNGTAFSDAVGGLVVNDAMLLAVSAQILTGMAVEAMCGYVESFDPYIAEVKYDDQQAEIAHNIRGLLDASKLAKGLDIAAIDRTNNADLTRQGVAEGRGQKLVQDRYPLRTSAQWLSPPTKDILMAFNQLQENINSTTDNPIVDARDPNHPRILNGGNFQGSTVANAMDKTRNALQLIGKLMFAQCTEIINPAMNNGLPANLAATDPSVDFCCKGLDINIAAYQSELGWLANPIGPHVQSAEMHNQAVNSLALLSARKTSEAVSVLQKMMASNLYILCQALDVRVMQEKFFAVAETKLKVRDFADDTDSKLKAQLWITIKSSWESSGAYDLLDRVDRAVAAASPVLLAHYGESAQDGFSACTAFRRIDSWQKNIKHLLLSNYSSIRDTHFVDYVDETPKFLSKHTAAVYSFVRRDLGVPMFQGLADSPTRENGRKDIGGYVGVIEMALKHRTIMGVLGKAVRDVAGIDAVFPRELELMVRGVH